MGDEAAEHHTFLFADMAGFTALTEVMGDEEAVTVAEGFFGSAREILDEHGAREVKTIGDALMIHISDAAPAVRLGLRLAGEIGGRHGFPSVRVGMHSGPAVRRGEDWFGATVNLAARVSGAAAGGEVLVTNATRAAAGELGDVDLLEHGRRRFRNVGEPVLLFRALAVAGRHELEDLPIDPVCRMAVDPARQAGLLIHDGVEYRFCSLDCAQRFAAEPERFAQPA
ncbi:MAG: adenylate/guanylate cyclase domain-containing protein [Solirubrobacterales bacterium]